MASKYITPRHKFILVGDSLTEFSFKLLYSGWGLLLTDKYHPFADVINRGLSSFNTRLALPLVEKMFTTNDLNLNDENEKLIVTLWFGANDAASNAQHTPLVEYKQNLIQMVQLIMKQATNNKFDVNVIVVTPPPCHQKQYDEFCALNKFTTGTRSEQQVKPYAESIHSLVTDLREEYGDRIHELNLWKNDAWLTPDSNLFCDGLHLSVSGNKLFFEALSQVIDQIYDWKQVEKPYAVFAELFGK